MTNKLYYGDNLGVLRDHIADESVDLVYLDPPFNSNATYNVLFKAPDGAQSQSQIEAFDDTWQWGETAEDAYWQVLKGPNTEAARMLEAMRGFLGENAMMAYLAMMAIRLIELHRVLKPTGSLYLHCDPTASHYLKILLDAVFGPRNFRNEITWKRTGHHGSARRWAPVHDVIFSTAKEISTNGTRHYSLTIRFMFLKSSEIRTIEVVFKTSALQAQVLGMGIQGDLGGDLIQLKKEGIGQFPRTREARSLAFPV